MAKGFRYGGAGDSSSEKSLVLPSNPTITLYPDDSIIKIMWGNPKTETEIAKYNIYYSTTKPNSLKDMTFVKSSSYMADTITPEMVQVVMYTDTIEGLTNDITYYVGLQSVDVNGYENASIWEVKNGIPTAFKFICVGNSGKAYYSTDGITWTAMSGLNSDYNYYAVTYGNGRFVCVGYNGKSAYSTDGVSWISMSGLDTVIYRGVTYGNGRFVCVGDSGKSAYSTDGVNWYPMSGLTAVCYAVTYGNGKFVCVGDSGHSYYSTDGVTWNGMGGQLNSASSYQGVAYGNNRFVCVAKNLSAYSTDGTTWTAVNEMDNNQHRSVAYGNGKFVCVGANGSSYYSTDGITWTAMSGLDSSASYWSVAYNNGRFICVGNQGQWAYSTDGTSWTARLGDGLATNKNYLGVCSIKP